MRELRLSLKIYKNALLSKYNKIDDVTADEWLAFKRNVTIWWKDTEDGIAEELKDLDKNLKEMSY